MWSKQFQSCSFVTTAGWRWGMNCECGHSTGKLSTGTRQEQICVSQNEKRAIFEEKSCCTEGREAAERRRAQVHMQLEGRGSRVAALLYENAAASTMQRAGWRKDEKVVPRKKKLQPGGAQQDVSKGNGGSVLCIKAKVWEVWQVHNHTVLGKKLFWGVSTVKSMSKHKTEMEITRKKKKLSMSKRSCAYGKAEIRAWHELAWKLRARGTPMKQAGCTKHGAAQSRSANLARQKKHVSNK